MTHRSEANSKLTFPLSSNQHALWLVYQFSPHSSAYNVYTTTQIKGNLNLELWRDSWKKLVQKHQILRTTYQMAHSQPIQILHQDSAIEIKVIDCFQIPEEQVKQRILQEANLPFNLEKGPLLRVCLFQLSPQITIQLIVIHEIAGELRSLGILLNDFFKLYSCQIKSIT